MLYAFHGTDGTTVVAAATSLAEFDEFYSRVVADHREADRADYTEDSQPDVITMMTDPIFSKLRKPPYVFKHLSPSQREAFSTRYALQVIGKNAVISKAEDMLEAVLDARDKANGLSDTRTIAEVLGIDKEDPWDKRSDEDKAKHQEKQDKHKEEYEKAKKEGRLSGDSFGGGDDQAARVTDVNVIRRADGTFEIGNIRAVKGLHDTTKDEAFEAEERVRIRADALANPDDYHVEPTNQKAEPQSKRPRDYVFAVSEDDLNGTGNVTTTVTITPAKLYEHTKVVEDRFLSQALDGNLPTNAIEIEAAIFAVPGAKADVRKAMEDLGYTHNDALQDAVDGVDPVEKALDAEEARIIADAKANPDNYDDNGSYSYPQSKVPDDYAFAAYNWDDETYKGTVVTITRRRVFDISRNPDMAELAGTLDGILPASMSEMLEGEFEYPGTPEEAIEELKKAGFIHHVQLQKQVNAKVAEAKAHAKGLTQSGVPAIPLGPTQGGAQPAQPAQGVQNIGQIFGGPQAAPKPSGARAKKQAPAGVISEDHGDNAAPVDRGPAINFDHNGDNIAVANDGFVSVYFKLEVTGAKLADVEPVLEAAGFLLKAAFVSRDHTAGCWFAFTRERSASDAAEILNGITDETFTPKIPGTFCTVFGINEMGERLAPEEIEIVDTGKVDETPIRPWNARRLNWIDLTPEEKEENRKEWSGKEFILICDYERATGCTVFITPKSYFYDNQQNPDGPLWPEELDLSHILPADLKPQGDNWYNTKSRDDNKLMYDLCHQRKFIDDWMLRLYLNQLGRA